MPTRTLGWPLLRGDLAGSEQPIQPVLERVTEVNEERVTEDDIERVTEGN